MNIIIRNETEKDYREVEIMTREAFWNLYFPGCDEHYLTHIMHNHEDFVPELDFVVEGDGKILGNIMYTKSWLTDESGEETEILSFGPLCVMPGYQRQGIGGKLINHTRQIAEQKGIKAIVILGDAHNYCKYGFKSCRDLNISDMNGEYPLGMLGLELTPGALQGKKWRYRYSDVYKIDEEKVAEFDATFPPKEKEYRYSQDIFGMHIRAYLK